MAALPFIRPSSLRLRAGVCVLLSLALMTADHRGWHTSALRGALSMVVYPVRFLVSEVFVDLPSAIQARLAANRDLAGENEALRGELLLLGVEIERLRELEGENGRLRELLDLSARIEDPVQVAKVIGVEIDPMLRRVELDKGLRHGVRRGQSVIDASGVLGQVAHAGPFSSTMILITDPDHALPVLLSRTGFRSIAVGRGAGGELELTHVPKDIDIEPEDLLVSSGLGGRFPGGYPAARVVRVERNEGEEYVHVRLRPVSDLKRVREVLVVSPSAQADESADAR